MNSKDLLLARIQALLDQLDSARAALESGDINAWLRQRTGNELKNEIADLKDKLSNDQLLIRESEASPNFWITVDNRISNSETLLRECLAYYQGARTRTAGPAADLCMIADQLLDAISEAIAGLKWNRFTILADGESFTDLTQIIRLRFPLRDIWNLPVAAHEFGHFLAERLNVKGPDQKHHLAFADYLKDRAPAQDRNWFFLNEYFADTFATYALGPSYGFTCFLLRFRPVGAWRGKDNKHPPDGNRAEVILGTMAKMSGEKDGQQIAGPYGRLKEMWYEALKGAGEPVDLVEKDKSQFAGFVAEFYQMLKEGARDVRYRTWDQARIIADSLSDPQKDPGNFTIPDILNAAWYCRLLPGTTPGLLNDRVIALCRAQVENS